MRKIRGKVRLSVVGGYLKKTRSLSEQLETLNQIKILRKKKRKIFLEPKAIGELLRKEYSELITMKALGNVQGGGCIVSTLTND